MLMQKRNFALTFIITGMLFAVLTLCDACAGSSSSTAPAVNAAGDPPSRKAIRGQGEKPVSVPDALPMEGGVPLYVHLWDGGSYDPDGEIVKWEWNFGDALPGEPAWQDFTDSEGDAWHWYTKPGDKVAHLRVTDNDDNQDVAFVKIEMRQGNNANPIAAASADPTSGDEPLTMSFSAAGSYDPDGAIVKYEWDFGEGAGYEDFTGTEGETGHEYAVGGLFTAILRVTDDDGAESMDSVDIDVNSKPTAVASADPTSGDEPLTVDCSAAGSYDPDGTIERYEWDFGEGDGYQDFTDTDGAADHEYTTEGTYLAVLRVTDDDGAQSTGGVEIEVIKSAVDDWRMLGHDSAHSGRSPFTGPTTNALKWTRSIGNPGWMSGSPVIAADGTIYLGVNDDPSGSSYNMLYAISSEGTVIWSYPTGGRITFPAIGVDESIYIGSADGNLYAINPDGILKWIFATGMSIYTSPTVDLDGTIYLSSWNNLCAINPDGTQKWSHWIDTTTSSSPAIGPDGTIYVGSGRYGWLYAINPDGTEKWIHYTDAGIRFRSSPAIAADGTIYIGSTIGLHAIDSEGSTKWVFPTSSSISSTPAIAANGTVYMRSLGLLWAINSGGTLEWTFNIGGNYSPAIGGDGTIYAAYWLNLCAINPDGTLKWNYTTDGRSFDGSAAIGVDGTIYVGAYYKVGREWAGYSRLYAFGPGEGV